MSIGIFGLIFILILMHIFKKPLRKVVDIADSSLDAVQEGVNRYRVESKLESNAELEKKYKLSTSREDIKKNNIDIEQLLQDLK